MRKFLALLIVGLMCFAEVPVFAQQSVAPGTGGWFCPGGGGGGRGMGWGGGAGRMGNYPPGQCPRGFGAMGTTGVSTASNVPLTKDQASKLLENYVLRYGNQNLKAGDVVEKGTVFEGTVTTKEGSLVERLEIDKNSGLFRRVM